MNGNWWDGATDADGDAGNGVTDPGDSAHWRTSWPGGLGDPPLDNPPQPAGTLPWTQGSDISFPNKGGNTNYNVTLTLYGNVEVNNFGGSGASTHVVINDRPDGAPTATGKLVMGSGALNYSTTITFNTDIALNGDLLVTGYLEHFNGAITDDGNHYGVTYDSGGSSGIFFDGNNTYAGATNILKSTLNLGANGSIAASSGLYLADIATFNASSHDGAVVQVLGGSGKVKAGTTEGVVVSDALNPGNAQDGTAGTGALTFSTGNLTLANNVSYHYDVNAAGSDLLDLQDGTVFFSGAWTLNLSDLSGGTVDPAGQTYVLFQLGNGNLVDLGNAAIDYGATGWSGGLISQSGDQIVLSNLTVPEPTTGALALLGLGGLLVLPRRKRQGA